MNVAYVFHPNLFLAFEVISFVLFVTILVRETLRKNINHIYEILSCAVFGMILEIGNVFFSHTYSYNPNFLINIFNIPLAIGCVWAIIIYCAMLLSDRLNTPWALRPFIDALTAIVLDLSMDAVAIRLGFWRWSIPLNQEWYGVPFENLVAWILVVLSFSFLIRFIRTLNHKRLSTKILMVLNPLLAYIMLVAGITVFSVIAIMPYQINNWTTLIVFNYHPDFTVLHNPQVQLWKLIVLVVLLVQLINLVTWATTRYHQNFIEKPDLFSFGVLSILHLFFLSAVFLTGMYRELPIIAVISLIMFILHCLLHFLPYLLRPKVISVVKQAGNSLKASGEQLETVIEKNFR